VVLIVRLAHALAADTAVRHGTPFVRCLLSGILAGLVSGLVDALAFGAVLGVVNGVVDASAVMLVTWLTAGIARTPRDARCVGAHAPVLGGLGFGLFYALVYSLFFGMAVGLAVGLMIDLATRLDVAKVPALKLTWTRSGLLAGALTGYVAGVTAGFAAGPGTGLVIGFVVCCAVGLSYGVDTPKNIVPVLPPPSLLARDRATFAIITGAVTVAIIVAVGLIAAKGRAFDASAAVLGALPCGLVTGAAIAAGRTPWARYTLTRLWFAATGRAPLRLMRFLADAHLHHGVLRQNGATYQFCHLDLQRRLAAAHRSAATTPRPRAAPRTPNHHMPSAPATPRHPEVRTARPGGSTG